MADAPPSLRALHLQSDQLTELAQLPAELPSKGFVWIGVSRPALEALLPELQAALQRWTGGASGGGQLVDLHVSDLMNLHLTSHFDYTSWYDLLVFRRLVATQRPDAADGSATARRTIDTIDTNPVGFAVFDRVLLTVHPVDCQVREYFVQRLAQLGQGSDIRGTSRVPASPADLMLRMVNHMVDGYLELRRLLTRQLGQLQEQLLNPHSHFSNWRMLLDSRNVLHTLEDTCED